MHAYCPEQTVSGADSMQTEHLSSSHFLYQAATVLAILLLLVSF